MEIRSKSFALLTISCAIALDAHGIGDKDPYTRDEDMSGVRMEVTVTTRPDGLYEYAYAVINPPTSIGTANFIDIDLTCSYPFENYTLPPTSKPMHTTVNDRQVAGKMTPVSLFADQGQSFSYSVGLNLTVGWGIVAGPGQETRYLRMVSPAAPGLRPYAIAPYLSTAGYNYPEDDEGPYDMPSSHTFTVTGLIAAPGCPGVTQPVDVASPRYAGSLRESYMDATETEAQNALLTYGAPLRNREALEATVETVTMEIHYGEAIDVKSFRIEPAWARNLFTPQPGTHETVLLPLKSAKNLFTLSVQARGELPGQRRGIPNGNLDKDLFEFRRHPAGAKAPGNRAEPKQ